MRFFGYRAIDFPILFKIRFSGLFQNRVSGLLRRRREIIGSPTFGSRIEAAPNNPGKAFFSKYLYT